MNTTRPLKSNKKGGSLIEIGILVGLVSILAIGSVSMLGKSVNNYFDETTQNLSNDNSSDSSSNGNDEPGSNLSGPNGETVFLSCQDAFDKGNTTNGVYYIDINQTAFPHYCNMITSDDALRGGWDTIAVQYTPVAVGWGDGIDPDRDPATYLQSSFSLSSAQIQPFTKLAFGRTLQDGSMSFIDALSYPDYQPSGYISTNAVSIVDESRGYQIARRKSGVNINCDPQMGYNSAPDYWTMTIDITDSDPNNYGDWMFAPLPTYQNYAYGYCYGGQYVRNQTVTYGWSLWVR